MREKLKGFYSAKSKSSNNPDTLVNKFRSEAKELMGDNSLP
jgi:hypothetical protein